MTSSERVRCVRCALRASCARRCSPVFMRVAAHRALASSCARIADERSRERLDERARRRSTTSRDDRRKVIAIALDDAHRVRSNKTTIADLDRDHARDDDRDDEHDDERDDDHDDDRALSSWRLAHSRRSILTIMNSLLRRSTLLILALLGASLTPLTSRAQQLSPASSTTRVDASTFVTARASVDATIRSLAVDAAALRAAAHASSVLTLDRFPIDATSLGTIELAPARAVIDARTRVRVGTSDGEIAGTLPSMRAWRGVIAAEAGSRVFIVAVGEEIYGFVEHGGGERFVIGPSTLEGAVAGEHVIAAERAFPDAVRDAAAACLAEGTKGYRSGGVRRSGARLASRDLLEVRVAVEADGEFLRRTGGTVEKATGYIVALWSMVSAMYEDEIDVTFRIPWIKVWTTADPYQVAGNAYELWGKAPAYWRANYADVDRDLAHIFTASDWGGGGIAFRGEGVDGNATVICSRETGYAMSSPRGVLSYPTFAFTYDAYIVAHETGHNFGARHTHDCWWSPALDTCMTRDSQEFGMGDACHAAPIVPIPSTGSVMSYCMGINQKSNGGGFDDWKVDLRFTPRVAAVMRQEVELAPCRRSPATPTIVLTNPRGRLTRVRADTTIDITWNAVGVSSYDVEYSADDGRTWFTIAADLAADVLTHRWTVPRVCSDSVWLRVVDGADATIGDTSLLRTSIAASVAPLPIVAEGSTRLCAGDSVRLVAPEGYARYRWSTGDTTRAIVVSRSGSYSVAVTLAGGCAGETAPLAVIALPPVPSPVVTRRGDTLSTSGGASYQWSIDGEPIAGATGATHVALVPGIYTVTITDADGCRAVSGPIIVGPSSAVSDAAARARTSMTIAGNGGADCCTMRFVLPAGARTVLAIHDNAGRRIATLVDGWRAAGMHDVQWERRGIATGAVWAVLRSGNDVVIERVMPRP